jgi:chemotaxis protein methyltransferase CheR
MACTDADFAYLRSIVLEQSSNALEPSRDYLFESKLQHLLNQAGHETLQQLVAALRRQPNLGLRRSIAEAMTVNETSFFRDRASFDLMRLELIPALIRGRASSRSLRLCSAACSSGQETYSLAMILLEYFPELRDWKVEILGTDISSEVIARAQAGRYQRIEVNRGLPARFLHKYFQPVGDEWDIVPQVKSSCRFQQRNLCSDPVLAEKFDLILLRNVMLYFPAEARRLLLLNIHQALAADGFLILGSSEQPDLPSHFQATVARDTCYHKPLCGQPG